MAKAVHIVSLERGLDPREFALVSFGGAGPMHAAELAEEVGIDEVIIPPWPGLFSALSMLLSDMKYTYVKGVLGSLREFQEDEIEHLFDSMTRDAHEKLAKRGITTQSSSILRNIDLRYAGQGFELEVEASSPFSKEEVITRFERRHGSVYGYSESGEDIEVTALRLTVVIPVQKTKLGASSTTHRKMEEETKSRRKCCFSGQWFDMNVYSRDLLPAGLKIDGPAIVEEYDSTVLVPPGWECESGDATCLILRRGAK
jgi:N-methylhydantoinase A